VLHQDSSTNPIGRLSYRFRKLSEAARPFRGRLFGLLGLLVLSSALESVGLALIPVVLTVLISEDSAAKVPKLVQPIIQEFPADALLLFVTSLVAAIFVLKQVVSMVTVGYSTTIINRMRDSWRSQIITRYLNAPLGETRAQQSGKLIENLVNQPIRAAKFMRFIIGMCANAILASALLIVLLQTSWQVTLVVGSLFVVIAMAGAIPLKRHAGRLGTRENKLLHQLTHMASEAVSGLQQIKIFGLEQQWHNQFMSASNAQSKTVYYSALLSETPNLIGSVALTVMVIAVVAFSIGQPGNNLSLVVLFILVGQRLHGAVSGLMSNYTNMRNLGPSFDLVIGLTKWAPEPAKGEQKYRPPLSSIEFDNVGFGYDGRQPLLENVSFILEPGKITALVGPSGSGKTTLVNLLCGLLVPSSGKILINGQPMSDYDPASWLRRISIVSQDNFLFHGTIRSNLLVGKSSAGFDSILVALREAGAEEFVAGLPEGQDTVVGERGASLSGGQVQRLAIARALLRDGDLMIFDEATSALDNLSQNQVLKGLRTLAQSGKTVLLISHRKETLAKADHLVEVSTVSHTVKL
jgi:ABC-type multidrug transport system fused ATPase/permease subunit